MKAICIRQPWAGNIADGSKTVEYRSWRTIYRGPLLIVVSRHKGGELAGKAICIVDVVDCQPSDGGYGWVLANVRPVQPFEVRGRLGLFEVQCPSE